jgi:glycosyltransferase involved in cell wall biosynthesis
MDLCVRWRGDFLGHHSMARVNRKLAEAMIALDAVDIVPQGEPTEAVERALHIASRRLEDVPPAAAQFALKHMWPPLYLTPPHGYSIHIQPYEYGAIADAWIDMTLRRADDVWCYTRYVQQQYIDAGVPPERTFVVPLGYDPAVYHPDVAPLNVGSPDTFVFLFVGGTIWRKGIDVLLNAYLSAFTTNDDVALIVKAFGNETFYKGQNYSDQIVALAARTDLPKVRHGDSEMSDADMAGLYRRADALVHPYRGEGFGLPVLEAMACGTAPIVTRGGATDDFVTGATGYRVDAVRTDLTRTFAEAEHRMPGWVLDVPTATLAAALRHAFEHRAEVSARGAQAAAHVRERFTWTHAAQTAVARLRDLRTREPLARRAESDALPAYEQSILSRNGEDGMLFELFSRLRVVAPVVVELAPGADTTSPAAALIRYAGWRAITIEADRARYDAHVAAYAAFPNLRCVHAPERAETIIAELAHDAIASGFDLVSMTAEHAIGGVWNALAALRPRAVVVCNQRAGGADGDASRLADAATVAAIARLLGYTPLGMERTATSAVFVRSDLAPLLGFAEAAP